MRAKIEIVLDVFRDPLVIRDLGPWDQFPTVTNDVEAVVAFLFRKEYLREGRRLFYYDSAGHLDEIVVKDRRFAGFLPGSNDDAIA